MARDLDEALVLLLGRCAGAGDGLPEGRYPVWADDRGRWQTGGPDHWAAGFATGAQALAEVCGVPVRGPALRPVVPDDVKTRISFRVLKTSCRRATASLNTVVKSGER